jgi:hypothetical protein
MKVVWMILAGAGGLLAVYFVIQENYEKAFVAAAAGAVCWVLNYRQQIRESMPADDEQNEEDEESDEEVSS